jgi:cytochrome c1
VSESGTEVTIDPEKEVAVQCGAQEFTGTNFAEHSMVLDQNAHVATKFADGTAAACGEKAAEVEFVEQLERPAANAREIVSGETRKTEG